MSIRDVENLGILSRKAKFYNAQSKLIVEYRTIENPTIAVTPCLKVTYSYDSNGLLIGEKLKSDIWTQALEDIVSPPITNIQLTNTTINPSLPSGTKVADIQVTGGVPPLAITLSSNPGNLFRIDNGDDLVLNAPSSSGNYPITVHVVDDDGKIATQNFTINVLSFSNTKSLQFDGVDERVDFGVNANFAFDRTTAYSVSGWFKAGAAAVTMHMFGNQGIAGTPRGWSVKIDSTKIITIVLSNTSANQIVVKTVNAFTDGLWHHLVLTYTGSSTASGMKIYIDGANQTLTVTNDNLTLTTATSNPLRAGASGDAAPSQFYSGNLDELAIWNKALSAGEVTEMYNSGDPADLILHSAASSLLHYYRMGDVDIFPTITDQKGLSNGTCINMEALDIKEDAP